MKYYPSLSELAKASKTLKTVKPFKMPSPSITKYTKMAKTGASRLGIVGAATAYGAHRIRKAGKALHKTIESQHTKSSMSDHQRMLDRAQRRRKAANKLRRTKTLRKLRKVDAPGSIKSPGYDHKVWR